MTLVSTHLAPSGHAMAWKVSLEAVATAFLLIAVVGSGIMAQRLCAGNVGLALLANAVATGGALVALILATETHMNPVVTLAAAVLGELPWRIVPAYIIAQFGGAMLGVWLAHIMFDLPVWQISGHVRTGAGQWVAEIVATFGLLAVIWGCQARHPGQTAIAVAAYITGAYWFTASTSFANPAVTFARAFSDSFAGIRPVDVPAFIAAQMIALGLFLIVQRLRSHEEIAS